MILLFIFGHISAMPIHQTEYHKSIGEKDASEDVSKLKNCNFIFAFLVLTPRQKFIQQLEPNVRYKLYIVDSERMRWPDNIVPYQLSMSYSAYSYIKSFYLKIFEF
jgi:hypothetical protein